MALSRRRFLVTGATAAATGALASGGMASADPRPADRPKPDDHGGRGPVGNWLAGDTHVHDDHSSDGSLPRQTSKQTLPGNLPVGDQIGEGERTGLAFMPLTDHRTYDQVWDPQWESDQLLLIPGEEANGSPHAIVLGNVDVIVDGANPPGSPAFRHVQQSIWDAHAQNAVWSTAHPDDGEFTPASGPNDNASAQGMSTVEVFNAAEDPDAEMQYAEDRWNRGFRFGVTAASDCHFREVWGTAGPGQPTTWVFAERRSVRAILDALQAGRTTVSSGIAGPMVTVEADLDGDGTYEAISGDEVVVRDRTLPKRATIRVRVRRAAGMTLSVFGAPGRSDGPLLTRVPASDDETYVFAPTLRSDHSWFRAEVRSVGAPSAFKADPNLPDQFRAGCSPVFVSVRALPAPGPELALPAPAVARDGARLISGDDGEFNGFADVAVTDADTHVVVERHAGGDMTVEYRRTAGRHGRGEAIEISEGSSTARSPRIAADGDDVWVVWVDERGNEQPHRPAIYLRHSTNRGRSFGPAKRLSDGKGRALHPTIAIAGGRRPIVAWADNAGGAFDVHVQIVGLDETPVNVSAAGKMISSGTPTDARSPRHPASIFPAIAVDPAGGVVLTWQDNRFDADPGWTGHTPPAGQPASGGTDPDNWQIVASVRPANASTWSTLRPVSQSAQSADRHPTVGVTRHGTVVAVWESSALQSSGVNLGLRSSRSTDGGLTWGPSEPVASAPAAMSQRPRIGAEADGALRVVWYDSRSDDWRWKVFTARFHDQDGWGTATPVSGTGNGTWPACHLGAVVFTSDRDARRSQRDRTHSVYLLGG